MSSPSPVTVLKEYFMSSVINGIRESGRRII